MPTIFDRSKRLKKSTGGGAGKLPEGSRRKKAEQTAKAAWAASRARSTTPSSNDLEQAEAGTGSRSDSGRSRSASRDIPVLTSPRAEQLKASALVAAPKPASHWEEAKEREATRAASELAARQARGLLRTQNGRAFDAATGGMPRVPSEGNMFLMDMEEDAGQVTFSV